jgi:hypothetical protein
MRDKESFNYKLVRSSTGRLADEAKRQKKKTRQQLLPTPVADEAD